MSVPTTTQAAPTAPNTPYSIGAIEGAVVAFIGAFASALALAGDTVPHAAEIGAVAAAGFLGYHAYQSS